MKASHHTRVAIYGAYGYTGRLIGAALVGAGFRPILAGRDGERLSALREPWADTLERRAVHPGRSDDLAAFLSGIDILVQCAGPYVSLPSGFSQVLSDWPGICLDVCGEFSVVEDSLRAQAENSGGIAGLRVHSCGFESFPAMWLAETILGEGWKASRVCTFYKHTHAKFSPGSRASARLASGRPKNIFADGVLRVARRDEWISNSLTPSGFPGHSALLSPLPEMALIPRRHGVKNCGSYALVPDEAARFLETGSTGETSIHAGVSRRPRSIPDGAERAQHGFTLIVTAWNESLESRSVRLHGRDPYGATAWMVRRMVEILGTSGTRPLGVRSPEEIYPARIGLPEAAQGLDFRLEIGAGAA